MPLLQRKGGHDALPIAFIVQTTHVVFFVHFCWGIVTLSSEVTKCSEPYPDPFITSINCTSKNSPPILRFFVLLLFKSLWLILQGSSHYQPKQCAANQSKWLQICIKFHPPKYDQNLPSLKRTFSPLKIAGKGRRSFSFGANGLFSGGNC